MILEDHSIVTEQSNFIHNEKEMTKEPHNGQLDYQSIAAWLTTGFFLSDTHFFSNSKYQHSEFGPDISWHCSPRQIFFPDVLNNFSDLFESLIEKNTIGMNIILPLSGGLDSRTLAAALKGRKDVVAVSYEFENGVRETEYARQIAAACGWEFHAYTIPRGYLQSLMKLHNMAI